MTLYVCPCTLVDGRAYPDPGKECPNGHTEGAHVDMREVADLMHRTLNTPDKPTDWDDYKEREGS